MHLENRTSTHDIDCFLNKRNYGRHHEVVRQELLFLIRRAAQTLRYKSDWANDEIKFFLTLLNDLGALFVDSEWQMRPIYQNHDLKIYAVKWEWALARKLKRLQRPLQISKPQDWVDCGSITILLLNREGAQLRPNLLRRYDHTDVETPVRPRIVAELRRRFRQSCNRDPFPALAWVYTRRGFQYQWFTGETIPYDVWPPRRGRDNVHIADQRRWRLYDFRRQTWL